MREIFEEGREASVRRIVLLLLAALVAGCGLGTLLGTGRVTAGLGADAAVAVNTALVQNSRVQALPTPEPLDTEEDGPLLERAELVVERLREGDYPSLAALVHPVKGVTLTPFSTVAPDCDRSMTAAQVSGLEKDEETYVWGVMDGSGAPIRATAGEYFDRFVYNADYAQAPEVAVDAVLLSGNALENVADAYPEGRFVDYTFPGLDPELGGFDWCSLKLVFEPWENDWYLVGLVHGEWTT